MITTRGCVPAPFLNTTTVVNLLGAFSPLLSSAGSNRPPGVLPADLTVASHTAGTVAAARGGWSGRLPPRYATDTWDRRFRAEVEAALGEGIAILDVGAGARPVVAPADRPPRCAYVGLDRSGEELARAPAGSYDERVVADVARFEPELRGRFDVALSWMVLEHVESVPAALDNLRAYLRPGGRLIAQLPGAFSLAALANRAVPAAVARRLLRRTQGRGAAEVFPARYDRCWFTALEQLLERGWDSPRVLPLFTGVFYFSFSRPLRAAYLGYEEWAWRNGHRNLAPYYLITAAAPERVATDS
jgi:SAM-dependent methyltransferase